MTLIEFYAKLLAAINAKLKAMQKFSARRIGTAPDLAEIRQLVEEGKTVEAQRLVLEHIKKELGQL